MKERTERGIEGERVCESEARRFLHFRHERRDIHRLLSVHQRNFQHATRGERERVSVIYAISPNEMKEEKRVRECCMANKTGAKF